MTASTTRPLVGIVMGSDSDYPVMRAAEEALAEFDRHGVRAGIAASMAAAEERSRAMSGD